MDFRIETYAVTGLPVIEVWRDGIHIASIYTNNYSDELKIVSRYLDGVTHESGMPPSLTVNFSLEAIERQKEAS